MSFSILKPFHQTNVVPDIAFWKTLVGEAVLDSIKFEAKQRGHQCHQRSKCNPTRSVRWIYMA